jgi:hypothetical protein
VITIFKGKGCTQDPGNYRGIALQGVFFKLLTWLLNIRIMTNVDHLLPPEQFGFRRGRGTRQALDKLLTDLRRETKDKKGVTYACFVDFEKAFDKVDRGILIDKLHKQFGIKGRILRLVSSILDTNKVLISDGLRMTNPVTQNNGVLQGDSLSPTLFLCYVSDLADKLREITGLDFILYADDLVMYSVEPETIRQALRTLQEWCDHNEMSVNTRKTKIMKFRKCGRFARTDIFFYKDNMLDIVPSYDYLGVTLQPSLTFTKHVRRRKAAAMSAIGTLRDLHLVSLTTALRIFDMKIKPILTYGFDTLAPFLTAQQMIEADRVKTVFLKRALRLPKHGSATLTLHLCETNTLMIELRNALDISNDAWNKYQTHRSAREQNFLDQHYGGPAFDTNDWKRPKQKYRHAYTRLTLHGFHHKLCQDCDFHDPSEDCICLMCKDSCDRYHVFSCKEFAKLDLKTPKDIVAYFDHH